MIIIRQKEYARGIGMKTVDSIIGFGQSLGRGINRASGNMNVATTEILHGAGSMKANVARAMNNMNGPISKTAKARQIIRARRNMQGKVAETIVNGVKTIENAAMNPGGATRNLTATVASRPVQSIVTTGGYGAQAMGYYIPGTTAGGAAVENALQRIPVYSRTTSKAGNAIRNGRIGSYIEGGVNGAISTLRALA